MTTSYVDLKSVCNAGFATALVRQQRGWGGFPIKAKKLDGFPAGLNVFARVPFDVVTPRGKPGHTMLVLNPDDAAERTFAVGAKFAALYVLHTIDRGDLGRQPVVYTLHYADGTSTERVITVGVDLADWLFPKETPGCRIGWTGYLSGNEFQKCVYVAEVVNPAPQKKVASISLQRHDLYGRYVLLGLTLSTAAPFFKPAAKGSHTGLADHINLASDILTLSDGRLEIAAELRSAAGRSLADAQLSASIGGKRFNFKKSPAGGYTLSLPRQKGWRQYANTVTILARRGGKVAARHDAVLYCDGRPRSLTPPHGHTPPQFIVVAFDDCKGLPGVEAMLDVVETVKAAGGHVPLTMYTSPCEPRSADMAKVKLLYKRMYDLGCEFCNHTLNHNPGGINWYALPPAGQEQEITGCRQWLRDNIPGLWHVYSQKTGGGGTRGFRDAKFSRADLMRRQEFQYNANNVTAEYDTNMPHPDVQFWPYKLAAEWAVDISMIDGNAPPVHTPITKGFYTDYSGKFDYDVADGVAMMVANFDYRFKNPNRPPLIINAMHEWGMHSYYPSHRNEKAILEGFLIEVLVKQRRKYPNTHVITLHQLIEYTRRDDIAAILAEGNGQDKKPE